MRRPDQGYMHPNDEIIPFNDDLDSPSPHYASPKKQSFLRSSLKNYNERNSRQFYITKPTFRAKNDLLIPQLFAESFDGTSAHKRRKETISLCRTVRDFKFNVIPQQPDKSIDLNHLTNVENLATFKGEILDSALYKTAAD